MREIKFRAIEKPSDYVIERGYIPKMVYGTGVFQDPVNTWLLSHDGSTSLAFGMSEHIVDPNTLGQFTGLRDKNGREIYEGDICRFPSCMDRTIYFDDGGFGYIASKDFIGFAGHRYLQEIVSGCEVIGNIHENPEFLDDHS